MLYVEHVTPCVCVSSTTQRQCENENRRKKKRKTRNHAGQVQIEYEMINENLYQCFLPTKQQKTLTTFFSFPPSAALVSFFSFNKITTNAKKKIIKRRKTKILLLYIYLYKSTYTLYKSRFFLFLLFFFLVAEIN